MAHRDGVEPVYSEYATLDLADVEPSLAGPPAPGRVALAARATASGGTRPDTASSTEAPQAAPHHLLTT